jgi:hypothetical protein
VLKVAGMTHVLQRHRLLALALAVAVSACGKSTPPRDASPGPGDAADAAGAADASAPAAPSPPVGAPGDAGAAGVDAGSADAPASAGGDDAGAAPVVADNKVAPTEGAELAARAKGLFEAIVKDEPERAEAFWFPRAPFVPLKDVKDPGKYWDQLHRSYVRDIHALHEKRKSWDGAELTGFDGWSHPKWVAPGHEANNIGYYRAFNGKLHYRVGGADAEIEVHTIITWQGRWYVTHLRKVKK